MKVFILTLIKYFVDLYCNLGRKLVKFGVSYKFVLTVKITLTPK